MGSRRSKALERRHEVVIVGANFAGLGAALELPADCDVVVVDPEPFFEWLPNIHELVSGVKKPSDLRLPRREILDNAGHRFVRARVAGIDPEGRSIDLDDGTTIGFDYCVVAIGGVGNDYGVPGVAEHAMPFKSVAECDAIGKRLRRLRSGASRNVSVVVVGGGLEGVEALGEILRDRRDRAGFEVHVVERGDRLMPEGPAAVDEILRRHVADRPVRIHCSERVAKITAQSVVLASGRRIRSDLTIWTGGTKPDDLVSDSDFPVTDRGWVEVRADLSCEGYPSVFAAGDTADVPRPIAKQAYHAIDMGRHAARNILRLREGKKTLVFEPAPKPMLVAFGDIDTFLMTETRVVASPTLAAAKEAVFQATIAGFDRLGSVSGLRRAGARGGRALSELVFPKLHSWKEATRLLSLRIEDA